MLINNNISRRRFGQGLLAGSAALALGGRAFAQNPANMTVVSHQVHKLVLTEGAGGDVTAPWREAARHRSRVDHARPQLDPRPAVPRGLAQRQRGLVRLPRQRPLDARRAAAVRAARRLHGERADRGPRGHRPGHAPARCELDGKTYGIPFRQATAGLHYNEALLEERGLSGPPKSIEEFADYARQLTYTRDDGTNVYGFAYEAQNYSNVVNIARAWGGAFITPDYKVRDRPSRR